MTSGKILGLALAALMGGSVVASYAEEAQTTSSESTEAKAETKAEKKETERKLKEIRFLPYKQLTSLSDEQKAKILEIHDKFLDDRKALEAKEEADIKAVLTPEQVAELEQIEQKRTAERKSKDAERREKMKQEAKDGGDADKTDEKPAP